VTPAPTYPLLTARLELRPFQDADLDAFHAMRNDPEHARFVPYGPAPREDVAGVLERQKQATALDGEGSTISLAVVERADGDFAGNVMLLRFDPETRSAELGFAFHHDHLGRGYATEAARALVDWAFADGGLHRIHARCIAENAASLRVLEKLGFREEGRLVRSTPVDGAWGDLVFGLLHDEW
jgi:RimJ/RimL family protein N-acetyltransferase